MADDAFDVEAWLRRIGHAGPRDPTLTTLRAVVSAHSGAIPFENFDVFLGRPPKLDLGSLQRKMIAGRRGGYCFEQNALLRAGLLALGYRVTGLMAGVIRGMEADAPAPATHMVLRVDLPEGPYLADVGFGNLTPTAPLTLVSHVEQSTPHEVMRFWPVEDELTLQARLGSGWQNVYRVSPRARINAEYEIANWYTATHPNSLFVNNLIAARPGAGGRRSTLFNGRLGTRAQDDKTERRTLADAADYEAVLTDTFGLALSGADLTAALAALTRSGTAGRSHPFFA